MFSAINTIDDAIDFGAAVNSVCRDVWDTVWLLAENATGLEEAAIGLWRSVKYWAVFAVAFVYFAGQAVGDLWRRRSIPPIENFVPGLDPAAESCVPEGHVLPIGGGDRALKIPRELKRVRRRHP